MVTYSECAYYGCNNTFRAGNRFNVNTPTYGKCGKGIVNAQFCGAACFYRQYGGWAVQFFSDAQLQMMYELRGAVLPVVKKGGKTTMNVETLGQWRDTIHEIMNDLKAVKTGKGLLDKLRKKKGRALHIHDNDDIVDVWSKLINFTVGLDLAISGHP